MINPLNATFNRRLFVKAISATGFGAALAATPVSAAMRIADILRIGGRSSEISRTRFIMGTDVTISAVHESAEEAAKGIQAAFDEMERLAALFDRRNTDSEISRLNRTGRLDNPSPEFVELIDHARSHYLRSNGVFDPTVPAEQVTQETQPDRSAHFSAAIRKNGNEMRLESKDVQINLDGIGRGYIVDRASEMLSSLGIENHLVNAGSDIRAKGERTPGQPWIVAITGPWKKEYFQAVITLKDAAVSTSGGKTFVNEKSAQPWASVSVTAPTSAEADALSTAAFLMDTRKAELFINGQKNCGGLMLAQDGKKTFSRSWQKLVGI
ncbi:FAD:protein FMN transferase [Maridesulfovibrio sp.]|uniref:FAD:protein FMN transferase n=1 Tax=Maridesulfovibrio sp. TaxID=2795000 RepID=UPI002A187E28|nr:FAD:protein FMN transferase [Maridesulfovibrio sp.]